MLWSSGLWEFVGLRVYKGLGGTGPQSEVHKPICIETPYQNPHCNSPLAMHTQPPRERERERDTYRYIMHIHIYNIHVYKPTQKPTDLGPSS